MDFFQSKATELRVAQFSRTKMNTVYLKWLIKMIKRNCF